MCALLIEKILIYSCILKSKIVNTLLQSKITIIIPSRSYDKNLSFCIKKIRQIYKKIKIIIILDKKESFKKDKNISVLVSGNKTIGYKRNLAVKHCKTDCVYFIDSDAYPTTSWLDQVDKTFKKYKRAAAVGGPNLSPPTNNIEKKLVLSAHDVSAGGMLTTLCEMCLAGGIGAKINFPKKLVNLNEYF